MGGLGWLKLKLRLSGAAELHRTQPQGASFPFPSLSFPLFFLFLSFCFLLGVGFGAAWQRRFLCFQFPLSLLSAFSFLFALCFLLQPPVPLYPLLFSSFPPFLLSMARCLHWQPWRLAVGIGCGLWCASPYGRAKGRA